MRIIHNLRVGQRDVDPALPSHQPGIREGNAGHERGVRDRRRRSTGIAPRHHEPIDPRMPRLTPA